LKAPLAAACMAVVFLPALAQAQEGCVIPTNNRSNQDKFAFLTEEDGNTLARLQYGAALWKTCRNMPEIVVGKPGEYKRGYEVWTVEEVESADMGQGNEGMCAVAGSIGILRKKKILINKFENDPETRELCSRSDVIAHEMGHSFGLKNVGDTENPNPLCGPRNGKPGSLMWVGDSRFRDLATETCHAALKNLGREILPTCEENPNQEYCRVQRPPGPWPVTPCSLNPISEGCRCWMNPYGFGCDPNCALNPLAPGCDGSLCSEFSIISCKTINVGDPNGQTVTFTASAASGTKKYTLNLKGTAIVTLSVTNMSRDFNCSLTPGRSDRVRPGHAISLLQPQMCSNQAGTATDSWTGTLTRGTHRISVFPADTSSSGNYTINVTARLPPPPTKTVLDVSETGVSSIKNHKFGLTHKSRVTVSLTGMTANFDCRVLLAFENCTNNSGTQDDSWSGVLDARSGHWLRVSPNPVGQSGDYRLVVTATPIVDPPSRPTTPVNPTPTPSPTPDPTPSPLDCPAIPNFRLPSGHPVNTLFPEATGGKAPYSYGLSGQPREITFTPSTRTATGTFPIVTRDTDYTLTYTCSDSAGASDSTTFGVTLLKATLPTAPQLTGSVSGRTQSLTWTKPSGAGITRYELQTRASSLHAWRFTGAGNPTPSSNISPSVHAWSVNTPWTLHREYRIRAVNSVGDGPWSNVVALTTPAAPPPALTLPEIRNFPGLPSGHTVNTLFPAATGGSPPYRYSVSGLPPGLSFANRTASGTLPTVRRSTTYTITYTVTDSVNASYSVTFTATVVPPPPAALSLPSIPNFRVPARGSVNTPFPAASGGTPPYSYGLSGLPPGLSFNGTTRVASGTLPNVRVETVYTITYSVRDSAGRSTSVSFTATVVPR